MENAAEMYGFLERVRQCHQLLQDDLSRKIFEVRLALDYAPSPANVTPIVALSKQQKWMDALDESIPAIVRTARQDPKKLVLYGTNVTGRAVASRLLGKGVLRAELGNLLYQLPGVANYRLAAPAEDVPAAVGELPTLQSLTIGEA